MRLFLAVYPPKEYLDYCRDVVRKFAKEKRNLQAAPIDQIHVTMRYIGPRVSDAHADSLIEEFKQHQGNFGKAELKMKRVQFGFPYQKDPKIVLVDLEDNDSLQSITDSAHGLIKKFKYRDTITWKERKKNDYHMTLARLKPTATRKQGKFVQSIVTEIPSPELEPVTVEDMYFVESVIQRGSTPKYRRLERIKL